MRKTLSGVAGHATVFFFVAIEKKVDIVGGNDSWESQASCSSLWRQVETEGFGFSVRVRVVA